MVNYFAVLVAAIAAMVLGALWYSPLLFGKLWMALSGLGEKKLNDMKAKGMTKGYVLGFLSNLVMAYVLAWVIGLGGVNIQNGLMISALAWLGFLATSSLGGVLWEGKSPKLYLLNAAHSLTSMLIMGAILGAWA
jgi:hypothetical protein